MKTQIPLGAHLVTQRTGYSHHGINIGDGFVIHYSGMADGLQSGPVAIVDIETFAAGNGFEIRTYTGSFPPDVIVQRANSRIGESAYNVFNNNCEHFC
ncbi:MAG: lecithin retinol acyltransferase family protein, partial [Burkholderiales bacterium]